MLIKLFHFFPGSVPVLRDIWLLGNAFLMSMQKTFQDQRQLATSFIDQRNQCNKPSSPFLYDMFNVHYFYKSTLVSRKNILLRVANAIVDAFSQRPYLPKAILIILDHDLFDMINTECWGMTEQINRCMSWIARQLCRELEARVEMLLKKRPGAVDHVEDTVIIWVEIFDRPYIGFKLAMKNRNKFNKIVNDITIWEKNTKVLNLSSLHWDHFDHLGQLTFSSRNQYWREIDSQMKDFFAGKNLLEPRYFILNATFQQQKSGPHSPLPFGMRCLNQPPEQQESSTIGSDTRTRQDRNHEHDRALERERCDHRRHQHQHLHHGHHDDRRHDAHRSSSSSPNGCRGPRCSLFERFQQYDRR